MKLMDFNSDQSCDVICEIIPYAEAIMSDKELTAKLQALAEKGKEKGLTKAQYATIGVKVIADFVPYLLKDHRSDLFHILALLDGKTAEEVAAQRFGDTLKEIKEAAKDPDLMELFT